MRKIWIFTLLVCSTFIFLGGCIVVKNSKITGGMPKDEQDKFADQVACKVVAKLKAEQRESYHPAPGMMPGMRMPITAASADTNEPNKPCKIVR